MTFSGLKPFNDCDVRISGVERMGADPRALVSELISWIADPVVC